MKNTNAKLIALLGAALLWATLAITAHANDFNQRPSGYFDKGQGQGQTGGGQGSLPCPPDVDPQCWNSMTPEQQKWAHQHPQEFHRMLDEKHRKEAGQQQQQQQGGQMGELGEMKDMTPEKMMEKMLEKMTPQQRKYAQEHPEQFRKILEQKRAMMQQRQQQQQQAQRNDEGSDRPPQPPFGGPGMMNESQGQNLQGPDQGQGSGPGSDEFRPPPPGAGPPHNEARRHDPRQQTQECVRNGELTAGEALALTEEDDAIADDERQYASASRDRDGGDDQDSPMPMPRRITSRQ